LALSVLACAARAYRTITGLTLNPSPTPRDFGSAVANGCKAHIRPIGQRQSVLRPKADMR